uniref:Uncharacterized protein n=1 Tax=Trichobilharzia regenti TaxID=157069 RepID=A0AA85J295_TRIRE|nr:unnamed protein product [Trichobilharzia regenti]
MSRVYRVNALKHKEHFCVILLTQISAICDQIAHSLQYFVIQTLKITSLLKVAENSGIDWKYFEASSCLVVLVVLWALSFFKFGSFEIALILLGITVIQS